MPLLVSLGLLLVRLAFVHSSRQLWLLMELGIRKRSLHTSTLVTARPQASRMKCRSALESMGQVEHTAPAQGPSLLVILRPGKPSVPSARTTTHLWAHNAAHQKSVLPMFSSTYKRPQDTGRGGYSTGGCPIGGCRIGTQRWSRPKYLFISMLNRSKVIYLFVHDRCSSGVTTKERLLFRYHTRPSLPPSFPSRQQLSDRPDRPYTFGCEINVLLVVVWYPCTDAAETPLLFLVFLSVSSRSSVRMSPPLLSKQLLDASGVGQKKKCGK